ncbi:MAG: apolipoprotein N-acyltransferase [Thiohalospira sp.]
MAERPAGWRADGLAALAGAATVGAFAPFELLPLAVLGPAVLLWLWQGATVGAAARRGFAFGLGLFGAGVHWVWVSIHTFGHTPAVLAGGLTLVFVVVLAGYFALQGAAGAWLARRLDARGVPATALLLVLHPALWVLVEWLRGWLFTGFPWLQLGYAAGEGPLAGWVPILGVFGASALLALSAGLLVRLLRPPRRAPVIALAVLWLASPLLGLVAWTEPTGERHSVAMVQGDVDQDEKWQPANRGWILERYARLSRQHAGADLVLWPETAVPAFYQQVSDTVLEPLAEELAEEGSELVVGSPRRGEAGYYNVLERVGAEERYTKHHLVPFGEYLPFDAWLRGLIDFFDLPMSDFRAGAPRQPPLAAGGMEMGVSICYEDAFGGEVRGPLPAAGVLVNVSNDAWWGDTVGPHQHLEIAAFRALEAGRPMLRATNNGITARIDHRGRVAERLPQFETAVMTTEVAPRSGATPWVQWGNAPVVVVAFGALAALGLWPTGRRRRA